MEHIHQYHKKIKKSYEAFDETTKKTTNVEYYQYENLSHEQSTEMLYKAIEELEKRIKVLEGNKKEDIPPPPPTPPPQENPPTMTSTTFSRVKKPIVMKL